MRNPLKKGGEVYTTMNCFACHGLHGEGNAIGPNLCDEYWLNGCSFNEVFNIIKNGNPAKGMTPFKGQINDEKIQQVTSYILGELMVGSTPRECKGIRRAKNVANKIFFTFRREMKGFPFLTN